ncbi:MAG: flavodoxin [Selenomonadaceae bacterium]|nr:flavodoxin [Selenomonadaceae bacterium]
MKKIFTAALSLLMIFFLTACGDTASNSAQKNSAATSDTASKPAPPPKKTIIVYYSRTGDNYEVGNIAKGNTHIAADIIAENVDADMFEIKPVEPYPFDYRECTEVAKSEQDANARPAYVGKVENFDQYDTVYLCYPIWWSDLPMIVYTFLEQNNFNGKTVIPLCTSASEVFIGKEDIENHAKGSKVLEGLGIRGKDCQYEQDKVRNMIQTWLKKVNA